MAEPSVSLYKAKFYFPFICDRNALRQDHIMGGEWREAEPPMPWDPRTFGTHRYFHSHARELLFSTKEQKRDRSVRHLVVDPEKIAGWLVQLAPYEKDPITVKLQSVTAMLFDLGVGVLTISLEWDSFAPPEQQPHLSLGQVLDLNNLFRRTCPGFVAAVAPASGQGYSGVPKGVSEIADEIRIGNDLDNPAISENFGDEFDRIFHQKQDTEFVGKHFRHWLESLQAALGLGRAANDKLHLTPVLDERNFVTSFVIDPTDRPSWKAPAAQTVVSPCNPFGTLTGESDETRKLLYQYVFIDPSSGPYVANADFRDRLLANALYLRYRDWGTYYGFTRYSGTFYFGTSDSTHNPAFARSVLQHHFDGMYHLMAVLIVAGRAILLDLSRRCAELSQSVKDTQSLSEPSIAQRVSELRKDFLLFNNKYWFNEVATQEQGMEMFQLWSRQSDNQSLFTEVESEIRAFHEFTQLQVNESLGILTYLSVTAVALALVGLLFQANGALYQTSVLALLTGLGLGFYSLKRANDIIRCLHWLVRKGSTKH